MVECQSDLYQKTRYRYIANANDIIIIAGYVHVNNYIDFSVKNNGKIKFQDSRLNSVPGIENLRCVNNPKSILSQYYEL